MSVYICTFEYRGSGKEKQTKKKNADLFNT